MKKMKKTAAFLAAAMLMTAAAASAEDIAALSDQDLMTLYRQVAEEVENRGIVPSVSIEDMAAETGAEQTAEECVAVFMHYWSANRVDDMVSLCSGAWRSQCEEPRRDLFAILANRTPISMETGTIYGTDQDDTSTVQVRALIDRNNGKEPLWYLLQIRTVKEDGIWYIDPTSLMSIATTDTLPKEQATSEPASDAAGITGETILYYNEEGGEFYHLDPNCRRVHTKYLPLKGCFTFAELNDEAYQELKACEICGAPDRPMTINAKDMTDLSSEGCDELLYCGKTPDGRILLAGFRAKDGDGDQGSARLVCLNKDRTKAWEFLDERNDGGRFTFACVLTDGTIGTYFWRMDNGEVKDRKLRFFTEDGHLTGREVILAEEDKSIFLSATPSRLEVYCDTEDANGRTILTDWDGNLTAMNGYNGYGMDIMTEETDGLVFCGYNPDNLQEAFIMKTDLDGNPVWKSVLPHIWPDTFDSRLKYIIRTDDGGYLGIQTEGMHNAENEYECRTALVKLDSKGKLMWTDVECFTDVSGYCNGIEKYHGKYAVYFVPQKNGIIDFSMSAPRTIRWINEDGNNQGTTRIILKPENFGRLAGYLKAGDDGKAKNPALNDIEMIPMDDGMWGLATIGATEADDGTWIWDSVDTVLIPIREP